MKICPKCGREFDITMSFCLDDGTPLRGDAVELEATTAVLSGLSGDQVTRELPPTSKDARPRQGNSVAVLPFVNMSADADNEYFCDGLAEELMNALANIDDLKVAARTAAFSFRGKNAPMAEIGRTLNVNSVLEGSVRKAGSHVRITVQLINAADGYNVWSERYDRELQDIFEIQDEITLAVVDALKVKLLGSEKSAVLKRHTENFEAYQLYLRGRFFWNKRTGKDLKQAAEYFKQAIEKEPNYAAALSGLAETYLFFSGFDVAPAGDSMPQAKEAALRALKIDDSLAEAHTALAFYLTHYEFDLESSEKEFRRAIELKPDYAIAHQWFAANLLIAKRFDESLAEMRLAEQLDPLSPDIGTDHGAALVFARRYDEAIAQLKSTIVREPNFSRAHSYLGWAYGLKGMYTEAVAEARTALELNDSHFIKGYLALWLARSGGRDEALEILAELEKAAGEGYVRPSTLAVVYIGLGLKAEALEQLEKEVSSRSFNAIYLAVLPEVDELRSEPRFKAMLKQMNLPE
jgi:TolB-like protein/Flp pilus assembly protein TadD